MNMRAVPVPAAIDPAEFRQTLGCFPTGVAIVTTCAPDGAPVGLTISSFNSVSMDPPLILWSLALKAQSLPLFRARGAFAVNVLAAGQESFCKRFSSDLQDRFAGLTWYRGLDGVPVLDGVAASFECRTWNRHAGGDHEIFLGEVVRHASTDTPPLVFGKGRVATLPTGIG